MEPLIDVLHCVCKSLLLFSCSSEVLVKGIAKATIKNQITIEDHKNSIYEAQNIYITNYTINSKKHHLETKEQYKIAIDPFDDKDIKSCNGEFMFYK